MFLDKTEKIIGIPILEVRKFLKGVGYSAFDVNRLISKFTLSGREAKALLGELIKRSLVRATSNDNGYWELTIKGSAFTMASAAKPICRHTADRLVKEFLERIEVVNNNIGYLFKVNTAVIFGSYLSDKEKINDIDIAIQLERKEKDFDKYRALKDQQITDEQLIGRVFRDYTYKLDWPEKKVRLFLKSRSRGLSFHPMEDLKIVTGAKRVIFGQIGDA